MNESRSEWLPSYRITGLSFARGCRRSRKIDSLASALATSTPDAVSTIRTSVEFRFNAANGVSYRIEASTDLEHWSTVETGIIGQGAVVTRFYSTENQPKRYFRVRRN